MNMSLDPIPVASRSTLQAQLRILIPLALVLSIDGLGCFHATGLSRPDTAVEEVPAKGGDRVYGLKATAGPGDFFLGNDSVAMAVDGAAFGNRPGQFDAASGGAVLDIGVIALDQSFHRVSMPTDMLERLGPVANQDPDLPLVFDQYTSGEAVSSVYLNMQGYLLDPKGKLGVGTDAQGRVNGVTVSHRISLDQGKIFFTLETTLANGSTATLPLRNLGDYLSQHGGGFRFVVPATAAFDGTPLPAWSWGVEIPGSDFAAPLTTSVAAPMVGLMGAESAGSTFDSHASLGLLPLDGNSLLVTSEPQHALTEIRPSVPGRLVVGGPAVANLPAGQSITYRRRLYVVGGASSSASLPAETTAVFSSMALDRATLNNGAVGYLSFNSFGTAAPGGPLQTEFRVERYQYTDPNPTSPTPFDPTNPGNPAALPQNWLLERVVWREPVDAAMASGPVGMYLPVVADPANPGSSYRYRLSARNAFETSAPLYLGTNVLDTTRPELPTPITPSKTQLWQLAEPLSPERADVLDAAGNVVSSRQTAHIFSARQAGTLEFGGMNPLRLTFQGLGAPDPSMQRTRVMSSAYSPVYKAKAPIGVNYGSYHYTAGNQIFGTAFGAAASSTLMYFTPGNYLAYATRGPMSQMDSMPVVAFAGQSNVNHAFTVFPPTLPAGWTSFDLPAPTQATTGGYNPGEMLSSAVSEGVQVVARTEQDQLTDPVALQAEFRAEIDIREVSDAQRAPLGNDPYVVGARSSALPGYGLATALFTPAPTTDRNGGARPSMGWTLADFITQAQGAFTVIHRPCGPDGLFTVQGFNPAQPLGTGANGWWTSTGPASLGTKNGAFDALELIQAASCNPADPTAWYAEFGKVRDDWFAILNQQSPLAFTKGLGLSAARFSLDTPVGLARTYLNIGPATTTLLQANLGMVAAALQNNSSAPYNSAVPYAGISAPMMTSALAALKSGAAVASTGPFLDVSVSGIGPGGLVTGSHASVSLLINLYAPDWVPVDEVRVVVNGAPPMQVPLASFTPSASDSRLRTTTLAVPMPVGRDAWLVVEAGVSRAQAGPYLAGSPWNKIMKGIYPIAITNPIFVDVNGGGYTPPGLP
jgi:hypothetical protein